MGRPGASVLVTRGRTPRDWLPDIIGHFLVRQWVGLFGVSFDQHSGLFFASPVYLLAVPGIVLLWWRSRTLALGCRLIFVGMYLLAGSYGVWYGGYSSPARLLTPTLPVLALALAAMLEAGSPRLRPLFAILAVPRFLHAYLADGAAQLHPLWGPADQT